MAEPAKHSGLDIFEAKDLMLLGWHVRRSGWVEDLTTPVQGRTKRATKWLCVVRGVGFRRLANQEAVGANRIIECTDLLIADLKAVDWTILDAEGNVPPDPPPGRPGGIDPPMPPYPSDSAAGSNAPGGSGGSGGTDGGETGGGGSGGGGLPGGGSGGRRGGGGEPKPEREAPALTLELTRTSGGCVTPHTADPITDTWNWEVEMGADPAAGGGDVWFINVGHGTPTGPVVLLSGTIAPGGNHSGMLTITKLPTRPGFPSESDVWARVYLARVGLSREVVKKAVMRGNCDEAPPEITGFNYDTDLNVVTFNRDSTEPVVQWSVGVQYKDNVAPAALGLVYTWTGDFTMGSPTGITIPNDNLPHTYNETLEVTNAYGTSTKSFTFIII